jgi:hypothetical protein
MVNRKVNRKAKIEVAKNMLAKNLVEDLIAEITGLSGEEIKKIQAEMSSNVQ